MPRMSPGDLREARVDPLAVRRGARVDDRRAGGRHPHVRGLVERRMQSHSLRPDSARGRQAADLDPGREADAAIDALAAQLLLLAAELVEVELLEQLVERAVVVARVVGDPERRRERELLLGDEVLAPQLEPVHAELVGEAVHRQLDPVGRLRPAGAADGVRAHLVREDAGDLDVDRRPLVAAAHHGEPERRDERREQHHVGAQVGDDVGLAAGDRAVALRAERDRVDLIAAVMARGHVLGAGLGPLDRAPEPLGEREHERLLAVNLELRPEAAAHVRSHHAELVLRDTQHPAEDEAGDVGDLRRGVEGQAFAAGLGDRAARLDRRARGAVVDEALGDRDVGLRERRVDVPAGHPPFMGLVGAEALPHERRAVLERGLGVDDDRLGVVFDDHLLGGVNRGTAARRHDHGDRVAHVLYLAALERPVVGLADLDPGRVPDRREPAKRSQPRAPRR